MPATPSTTCLGYFVISVSVAKCPAASAVSRIPKRAHSIESTRVRFSTAARAADECAMPGSPWCGESVTLTILPPRGSPSGPPIMARVATAWVISQVPSTFSRSTVRKPFGVMSSAGVMYWPPALFTSRSIRPWRSSTPSTSASTWSSSRMSQTRASTRPSSACRGGLLERLRAPAADDHARRPARRARAPSPGRGPSRRRSRSPPGRRAGPGWKSFEGMAAPA